MLEEYNSLIKIETWELVQPPAGRTPVSCKWVFKLKLDKTGQVSRYKARLVARGLSQKYKIDYDETFSPTLRAETIRCLLILAFEYKLHMLQMDVKTAFLHGLLEAEIFMTQPEGYIKGNANMVCRLKKAIYGLKQASRSWNEVFTNFLKEFNLKQLYTDCCVFANYNCNFNKGGTVLVVAIYVDDGLILSNQKHLMHQVVYHLSKKFEINTMQLESFVGLQIKQTDNAILLHQQNYINRVLTRFEMDQAKSATPSDCNQKLGKEGATDGQDAKVIDVPYQEVIGNYFGQHSRRSFLRHLQAEEGSD